MIKIFLIAFLGTATPVLAVIDPMAANQWSLACDTVPLSSQLVEPSRSHQDGNQAGSFPVTFSGRSSMIVQKIGIGGHLGLLVPVAFPEMKSTADQDGAAPAPVIVIGAHLPHDVTAATITEPATGLVMGLILFLLTLCFRPRRVPGSADVLVGISKP